MSAHTRCFVTVVLMAAAYAGIASAQPATDPCTLVARSDVEQVVGKLKAQPRSITNDRLRMCEYEPAAGSDSLSVWLMPATGLDRAKQEYKDLTATSDVAPESFIHTNTRLKEIELFARKGDVTLRVAMPQAAGVADKVKALARRALARL